MNLNTLTHGEPWMTPQEHHLNSEFIRATTDFLAAQGIQETPLITLRVNDVIVTWLLARRLETALTPPEDGPAPCPTLAQAGSIGKCRERLRRAIKELEACCPRTTGPNAPGLTDRMCPVIRNGHDAGPINENAGSEGTRKPENPDPDPAENAPVESQHTSRHTHGAVENCANQTPRTSPVKSRTDPTAPVSGAGVPTVRPRPQAPHTTSSDRDPGILLTWTERAKAPPGLRNRG